jgi:hypothetical protein
LIDCGTSLGIYSARVLEEVTFRKDSRVVGVISARVALRYMAELPRHVFDHFLCQKRGALNFKALKLSFLGEKFRFLRIFGVNQGQKQERQTK